MVFFFFSAEAKSLVRAIYKFQRNIDHKNTFCINFALQKLVDYIAIITLLNLPLFDTPKRKTRVAIFAFSRFYNSSWFTDIDKFIEIVARFEEIIANF